MRIIDAHLHIWDTDRLDYVWLHDVPSLDRPMGFGELRSERASGTAHVDGFVFVQADCRPDQAIDEVDWVASVAADGPVVGIVGFAPLEHGDAVSVHLDALVQHELVVGVRRLLQSEPAGFSRSDAFVTGARALASRSLVFDACVTAGQIDDVTALADAVPELRIVLDHLGKPDAARTASLEAWQRSIAQLALRPNVVCKVSGLPTQLGDLHWDGGSIRPWLDAALESFGADRLLFGSDWPASSGHTSYDRWLDAVVEWSAPLSPDERSALFADTATRTYSLPPQG
ncbi:amidohydrolase family protein [Labedella endophytica]|nr:amidohydrolase family protein [Labedella endophytica]